MMSVRRVSWICAGVRPSPDVPGQAVGRMRRRLSVDEPRGAPGRLCYHAFLFLMD